MRHKVAGYKLGRNTAHRRSLLRNLVTSVIVEERIETTVPKAKAAKPLVEKMITLGKRGDLAAKAFLELLGSEKILDEKKEKRAEARAKKSAEAKKAMEEAEAQAQVESETAPAEGGEKKE